MPGLKLKGGSCELGEGGSCSRWRRGAGQAEGLGFGAVARLVCNVCNPLGRSIPGWVSRHHAEGCIQTRGAASLQGRRRELRLHSRQEGSRQRPSHKACLPLLPQHPAPP